MPVYSRRRTNPVTEYWAAYERTGEVAHEGLVLEVARREIRIWSDVWADEHYAVVWDAEKGVPAHVSLYNTEFGGDKEAEVDATPEVRAAYDSFLKEKARLAREAEHRGFCENARLRLLVPVVGCPARVVKGRKVKVGTEGTITWKGPGSYGERVALKDASGNVQYTAIDNVVRTGIDLLPGEDWLAAERRLTVVLPRKWDRVRVVTGADAGKSGTVFYVNGQRLGVATTDRKVGGRYADVAWVCAGDVRVVEDGHDAEPTFTNADPVAPTAGDEIPF